MLISDKVQGFIIYRIWYNWGIAYVGRTKQPLQQRIRGHLFKKPMHKYLDLEFIKKIEYVQLKTQADMYLYEVYFINKYKPPINQDDKAQDELTVDLPDLEWKEFQIDFTKWAKQLGVNLKEVQND